MASHSPAGAAVEAVATEVTLPASLSSHSDSVPGPGRASSDAFEDLRLKNDSRDEVEVVALPVEPKLTLLPLCEETHANA